MEIKMNKVEKIEANGEIIAIVVRRGSEIEGINFFSPPEFSQQLGLISRKKDYIIKPHIHRLVTRKVSVTQEVLHILSGRIEVMLYNKDKEKIKSLELKGGDTILLASGGHGIKFIEDSKILEVKQGPYSGVDGDKEHF
jgi:cupin fold WbuC family metalloprotein